MSFIDDMGFDAYSMESLSSHTENDEDKIWLTKEGEEIKYKDLETRHIQNIIKLFKFGENDVPNLFKELKSRSI